MKTLVKLFVVILIVHGSTAGFVSNGLSALKNASETVKSSVSGKIESLANATSNISASILLKALHITENGILNLNNLIQGLSLPGSNLKDIVSSLNISVSDDGEVDLKDIFQNVNLSSVNIPDVLSLLNVTISNGVLDFSNLIKNIASHASLSDFVSALTVQTTEDGQLDFTGLALKYIGEVLTYSVTTEDGYILEIYRIPGKGKPVVISHGLMCTADDFIIRGETSLVYKLAQEGFDVWIITYRGSKYSRKHIELNPDTDKKAFFNYSMDDMGKKDLKAVIDLVLSTTGADSLSLIGHSEGTSAAFILFSSIAEYADVIDLFIALSPVADLSDSGLALTATIRLGPAINKILLAFGVEELLGFDSLERRLFQFLCSQGKIGYELCYNGIFGALSGYDPDQLNLEFFHTLLGHYPAGTSRKNLIHYVQVGNNNRFAQFDYGSKNDEYYGSEIPPLYDLSKVTCRVSMYMSRNDQIVGLKAAANVRDQLPNVVGYHIVEYDPFSHTDFTYAENAHEQVYEQIISELYGNSD
ncbi:lipase member K-like [Helicoverpa zea]|uniref:lipase member K-like n=1 Tax=Helicoverpa zea TaxID=7113 RepID=UPI001F566F09|nr:lipase member K-like [Helicoverpa zea]